MQAATNTQHTWMLDASVHVNKYVDAYRYVSLLWLLLPDESSPHLSLLLNSACRQSTVLRKCDPFQPV